MLVNYIYVITHSKQLKSWHFEHHQQSLYSVQITRAWCFTAIKPTAFAACKGFKTLFLVPLNHRLPSAATRYGTAVHSPTHYTICNGSLECELDTMSHTKSSELHFAPAFRLLLLTCAITAAAAAPGAQEAITAHTRVATTNQGSYVKTELLLRRIVEECSRRCRALATCADPRLLQPSMHQAGSCGQLPPANICLMQQPAYHA